MPDADGDDIVIPAGTPCTYVATCSATPLKRFPAALDPEQPAVAITTVTVDRAAIRGVFICAGRIRLVGLVCDLINPDVSVWT